MTNVLIVEDQKLARDNLVSRVSESERYALAGAIANAALAEMFCLSHQVDLILMDVCTELDESGLDAAAVIKKRSPQIKIIIVTSMAEHSFLTRAREAGADSFWYKETGSDDLLDVMDRTMAGESVYPERTPPVQLGMASSYDLTETELEVLRAVMETETYGETAEKLHCSEANVRYHMGNILSKTGYANKFKLCMAVAKKNLIITDTDKGLH